MKAVREKEVKLRGIGFVKEPGVEDVYNLPVIKLAACVVGRRCRRDVVRWMSVTTSIGMSTLVVSQLQQPTDRLIDELITSIVTRLHRRLLAATDVLSQQHLVTSPTERDSSLIFTKFGQSYHWPQGTT